MQDSISEYFVAIDVPPEVMDCLWAEGWRHFGAFFFRYSFYDYGDKRHSIIPLRIQVSKFNPSKSQRRVLRKNQDLKHVIKPTEIDDERRRLFELHKRRFKHNLPEAIENFLGDYPAFIPCKNIEIGVYLGTKLIATSYLDIGKEAVSSVYAIFDPQFARRSPGIYTMLLELFYAKENGFKYYYHGYASIEPSPYDYKKQFNALEYYDWAIGEWYEFNKFDKKF